MLARLTSKRNDNIGRHARVCISFQLLKTIDNVSFLGCVAMRSGEATNCRPADASQLMPCICCDARKK